MILQVSPPSATDLSDYVNNIENSNIITELGAKGNVGEICTGYIDIVSMINAQRRNTQTGKRSVLATQI